MKSRYMLVTQSLDRVAADESMSPAGPNQLDSYFTNRQICTLVLCELWVLLVDVLELGLVLVELFVDNRGSSP